MNDLPAPTRDEIKHAAALIRDGKLVAFPTETVYGLGANALDSAAVARIFEAKDRPTTSPIIVHVSSLEMAKSVVAEWPQAAQKLAQTFWPGPLTLVLKKQSAVPELVTAGLETVGVRMPSHPVALALIEASQRPIAAPSANRFTQLSPTTADHVRQSLGARVDYVLEGGPCTVGIESTVLSLAGGKAVLLRPGGVSRQQIEKVIGAIALQTDAPAEAHPSPGMHPRHYSPRTKLLLLRNGEVPEHGRGAYLQLASPPKQSVGKIVTMPADAAAYAAELYRVLHELDSHGYDWIAVDTPADTPEWEAVGDRLRRAATEAERKDTRPKS
jgi:L-threonylcarbamoyladenylate synthase